jgi:ABC-type nitrate/sulfonate/bicarbonate transport system substrate-binding protein
MNATPHRARPAVALLLALPCLVASCKRDPSRQSPPPAMAVSFTCSKNIWCTLPIVAKEKGLFRAEGLDVRFEYVQAAKLAMDALVAGSTDFAGVVEVNVAFLGFSGNTDVRVVATFVESHDGAIVARRSAGVQVPRDLAGKKLGILQGTTSQIYADHFLKKHGMTGAQVQIVNLQPVAIQSALIEKAIVAGSVWQPFVHNVTKALGEDAVVFQDRDVYTGYMNLAVQRGLVDAKPDLVRAVLRALQRAQALVRDQQAEAQALMAGVLNLQPATVQAIWGDYVFQLTLKDRALLDAIRGEGQWIQATQPGFADKKVPEYGIYVDTRFSGAVSQTP